MNKRIVIIAVILGILIGLGIVIPVLVQTMNSDKYVSKVKADAVTRYEWLQMLCEQFGIEPDMSEEQYFSDVEEDGTYYGYVQAAVSCGLLENEKTFEGDKLASGKFIALTAMKAMGEYNVKIYMGKQEQLTDKDYLQVANDEDIILTQQWHDTFTEAESRELLIKFGELFTEGMWKKSVSEVDYTDSVVELNDLDIVKYVNADQIEINEEIAKELSKDMIIVYQQENTDLKTARRVTDINKGVLVLEEPPIDEVIDSLMVSDMTTINFDDILRYKNITEPIAANDSYRTLLAYEQNDVRKVGNLVDSKGFGIRIDYEAGNPEEATATITNNDTGDAFNFPVDFGEIDEESDCDIHATVEFDKIKIGTQLIYNKDNGVEYIDLQTEANMIMSGEMNLEGEQRLKLFETLTPLGGYVVGVNLEVYLVLSQSGSISLQVEVPMQSKVYYEKDEGFRTYSYPDNEPEASIVVNCEAKISDCLEAIVTILDVCDVMDAEFDVGTKAEAEMQVYEDCVLQCMDIDISFPIITLQVCGDDDKDTILGELGLSAEWEMVTADNAFVKESLHYELPPEGEGFVEECTYTSEKDISAEKKEDIETTENEDITTQEGGYKTYVTNYGKVNMVTAPGFGFAYPNNWVIASETVNGDNYVGEEVILTNERGVTITYLDSETSPTYANHVLVHANVTKVADVNLDLTYMMDGSVSELGKFMVAKITVDGVLQRETDSDFRETEERVYYAVIEEKYADTEFTMTSCEYYLNAYTDFFFDYHGFYTFFATAPDGQFTKEEEQEVIQILSSFTTAYYRA